VEIVELVDTKSCWLNGSAELSTGARGVPSRRRNTSVIAV
jgi:hypothetical protein